MRIIDEEKYYNLPDKAKKKLLHDTFKPGYKVYHDAYGDGEFLTFDPETFFIAVVNFPDGEHQFNNHVVSCLELETPPIIHVPKKKKENKKQEPLAPPASVVMMAPVSEIDVTGWNLRGDEAYHGDDFEELKDSMRATGFWKHKALLVRPAGEEGYQLIAGHRRLRAAVEIGLETVPVIVEVMDDRAARMMIFLDNFHRKDLAPMQEAAGIAMLLENGWKQDELASKMGKSQGWVAGRLRLIKAPEEIKELIITQVITPHHAIDLLKYAEYPVLHEQILPAIRQESSSGKTVTVVQMHNIIDRKITWDQDGESVLNLTNFPDDFGIYGPYYNFEGCQGCQHVYTPSAEEAEGYNRIRSLIRNRVYTPSAEEAEGEVETQDPDEIERYCMNRRCWADRLEIAKQAYEKTMKEKLGPAARENAVDPREMNWNEYRRLQVNWDTAECSGCKTCKRNSRNTDELICLGVACFEKKNKAYQREVQKKLREEELAAYAELDTIIADITKGNEKATDVIQNEGWTDWFAMPLGGLRGILRILVWHLANDGIKRALEPWGKGKLVHEFVKIVDELPREDLTKALMRCVLYQPLCGYGAVNHQKVISAVNFYNGIGKKRGYG